MHEVRVRERGALERACAKADVRGVVVGTGFPRKGFVGEEGEREETHGKGSR